MSGLYYFLSGVAMFGALTCCLFFLRFWRTTRDQLFLIFAGAFALFAIERTLFGFIRGPVTEDHALIYCIRLIGFLLIVYGVWQKNRKAT